jgi:hypothetical protein
MADEIPQQDGEIDTSHLDAFSAVKSFLRELARDPSIALKDISEDRLKQSSEVVRSAVTLPQFTRRVYQQINPRVDDICDAQIGIAVISSSETVCSVIPADAKSVTSKIQSISKIMSPKNLDWMLQKISENQEYHDSCMSFMLYSFSNSKHPICLHCNGNMHLSTMIAAVPLCAELVSIGKNASGKAGHMLFVLVEKDGKMNPIVFPPWSLEMSRQNMRSIDVVGIEKSFVSQVEECEELGAQSTATIMHVSESQLHMITFGMKFHSDDDGWQSGNVDIECASGVISYTHDRALSN